MITVRYKNFHVVGEGENLYILFVLYVSSKPKDQYITDILAWVKDQI